MPDETDIKINKFYRWVFGFAGFFNILSVIMFIFNYKFYFQSYGFDLAYDPVWTTLYLGFIALFGIGYFLVSANPDKNHGIVIMGVIGKIFVFSVFLFFAIRKIIAPGVAITAVIDLIFAVLFIRYLTAISRLSAKKS